MKPLRRTVVLLLALFAGAAHARTLDADIARVRMPIATLEGVHVHLDWPANATEGALHLTAARVDAPDLGVHARNLAWTWDEELA